MPLAAGDRVRITKNGWTADRKHRLDNGALLRVAAVSPRGELRFDNGWTVGPDFGHLTHGYVVTSHAAQGKTVDRVLIAQSSASFAASSPEQLYVSASRGRDAATIYTDSRAGLRDAVQRVQPRMSATDLLAVGRPLANPLGERLRNHARRMLRWLHWAKSVGARGPAPGLREPLPAQEHAHER